MGRLDQHPARKLRVLAYHPGPTVAFMQMPANPDQAVPISQVALTGGALVVPESCVLGLRIRSGL